MKHPSVAALRRAAGEVRDRVVVGSRWLVHAALDGVRSFTTAPRSSGAGSRRAPPAPSPSRPTVAPIADASTSAASRTTDTTARQRLPLGEVIRMLRTGHMAIHALSPLTGLSFFAPETRPGPEIPAGARWVSRDFVCAAGERAYRLYVPASAPLRPRGLIVMLHGCKQDADDFALGTGMNAVAEEEGFLVAYPEQARTANPMGCWNWFRPADQGRDGGEPAIIAEITRTLIEEFDLDRTRVFVAGLSAGAAMALVLGATHPDLFAAVGSHSGVAYGAASDVMSALATMRDGGDHGGRRDGAGGVRTIVFQGSADRTVHPTNAERIVAALRPDVDNPVMSERRSDNFTMSDRRSGNPTMSERRSGNPTMSERRSDGRAPDGRAYRRTTYVDARGTARIDYWLIEGAEHAWSGGNPGGSHADPSGPNASREMMRFFLADRIGRLS